MNRGLTLIELIVAISVIGIVTAIATPHVMLATAKSRASEIPRNVIRIRDAQNMYFQEEKKYRSGAFWNYQHVSDNYDLGVNIEHSRYVQYNTMRTKDAFNVNARIIEGRTIGKAGNRVQVTLNPSEGVYVRGGENKDQYAMKTYLRSFIH